MAHVIEIHVNDQEFEANHTPPAELTEVGDAVLTLRDRASKIVLDGVTVHDAAEFGDLEEFEIPEDEEYVNFRTGAPYRRSVEITEEVPA